MDNGIRKAHRVVGCTLKAGLPQYAEHNSGHPLADRRLQFAALCGDDTDVT